MASLPRRDSCLILDADINKRAATELRKRARNATSVYTLKIEGMLDPELLRELAERYADDWVLATADDRMPYRHAVEVAASTGAIATVDPRKPADVHIDAWRRDIVHKWADRMQKQEGGSVYRYSMDSARTWKPRAVYLLEER
jgi:hypothetical protein